MDARETLLCAATLIEALRSQWRDAAAQRERQHLALVTQVRHAALRVPFYRASWAQAGVEPASLRSVEDLSRLPIVRRGQIQEQPEAFLAEGGDRRRWHRSRTSGSTGQPLESWFDPACWRQVKYALKARRLLASGWRPGQRIIIIEAMAQAALPGQAGTQRPSGERGMRGCQYLSVFESPERHVPALIASAPRYLYGFPSYFEALARIWDASLRRRIPLRALMTSGEWVHPAARARLERTFGVPVLDVYGSTEFKEIAWQCPGRSGYHMNMESVVVEIVDEEGRAASPGEAGDVVVTSLTNRAMPLIRYATGDRARRLGGRCQCRRGLERLECVEGRVADYLRTPDAGVVSPYELTTAMEEHPEVLQYKVTQASAETLRVAVVLRRGADDSVLSRIRRDVTGCLRNLMEVEVSAVPSIPRAPSGKHCLVEVSVRAGAGR